MRNSLILLIIVCIVASSGCNTVGHVPPATTQSSGELEITVRPRDGNRIPTGDIVVVFLDNKAVFQQTVTGSQNFPMSCKVPEPAYEDSGSCKSESSYWQHSVNARAFKNGQMEFLFCGEMTAMHKDFESGKSIEMVLVPVRE